MIVQQRNPFDAFDQPAHGGMIIAHGAPADPSREPLTAAQLKIEEARAAQAAAQQAADTRIKNAQADKLERDNRDAAIAARPLDPSLDNLTGPAFTEKLPQATQATVQALVDGRMGFPSGAALRSPYWQQMLQYVAHADPSFDATNFGARSATRRDFVAGKSAQNIRSLNTAIGHLGQLDSQISGTASHGGLPFATTLNAAENALYRSAGSSGITNYEQTAGALSSELTQVFRGSGGAEADIIREMANLSADNSDEQKRGAVRNIAGLLKSRLDALGDQYTQGMGTTARPLSLLNPHAKQAYSVLSGLGVGGDPTGGSGGSSGTGSGGPTLPQGGGAPPAPNAVSASPTPGGPPMVLATGDTKAIDTSKVNAVIDGMIRSGASDAQISAAIGPLGFSSVDPRQTAAARAFLAKNPTYTGSFGGVRATAPTTAWERMKSNPIVNGVATGALAAGDAALLGTSDEIGGVTKSVFTGRPVSEEIAGLNQDKQAAFAANPGLALTGQLIGATGGMAAVGGGLAASGAKAAFPRMAPLLGDIAFGAASGAGENNDNRTAGALVGAGLGAGGSLLGYGAAKAIGAAARTDAGLAITNIARDLIDKAPGQWSPQPIVPAAALTPAEQTLRNTIATAGEDKVAAALTNGSAINAPVSLADAAPSLGELAAAAVRRSPAAREFAEPILTSRSQGQIDRFGQAVDSNLGPTGNTLAISRALTQQARTDAAPLYDAAYAVPGRTSDEINSLFNTPFGRESLSKARTIAANERVDPNKLGFDLNDQGETVLTSVPSMRTIDYAKQGMDDVLEQYRNPITGRLELSPAGRAQNLVKNQLLAEADNLVPEYRDARRAFQGPMESLDALHQGQDFYGPGVNANQIADSVVGLTPEHLAQAQLGYRDAMLGQANKLSYSTNPWNILNTPAAEAKLGAMYPDSEGVTNLLNQRDVERGMASTASRIIGGSPTAPRQIADQQFMSGAGPSIALDGMTMAMGGVPTQTVTRALMASSIGDAIRLGIGKRAMAKADELVPKLLNTDPDASEAIVKDLMDKAAAYQAWKKATDPTGALSRFGAGAGVATADTMAR